MDLAVIQRMKCKRRSQLQPLQSPRNPLKTLLPGKESFTWSTLVRPWKDGEWISSGEYKTKALENCELRFSMKLCTIDSTTHVDIIIYKSNPEAVCAKINVCLVQDAIQYVEIANSWEKTFRMKRLPMPSFFDNPYRYYDIFVEIIWLNSETSLVEPEPPNLYKEVGKFLTDSTFSDATIVIENEEIKVHKFILCACSSVFHDMFTNPMREKQENRVEITDFEADTVKIVLKFLYTGNYEALDDVDTALDILAFAQKYNMIKLKEICEYKLSNYIMLNNVLKILNAADDHNAVDLEQKCLEFMSTNRELLKNQPDLEKLCKAKPVLMYKFLKSAL